MGVTCCGDAVGMERNFYPEKLCDTIFVLKGGMCEAPALTEEETFPFLVMKCLECVPDVFSPSSGMFSSCFQCILFLIH